VAAGESAAVADHRMRVDRVSSRPKRVLIVVAGPATSTTLGWPVWFWGAELTHPYYELAGPNRTRREMMTVGGIAVHEFVTLDGVMGDPSWSFDYSFDPGMGEAIGQIMGSSKALLLGRRTYEEFAPTWSTRTAEDDPGAPFMNETPKYVVSSSLRAADWSNSVILGPYDAGTIRDLKDRVDGNIYISGSGTLVRALLADGLVDELHLFVYPLAHGRGQRLFPDTGPATKFALAGSEAYGNGVLHLTYISATPAASDAGD
jgi:dihydrofolate reductase